MNILLIGGTGTISNEVTNRCVKLGYSVSIMNRGLRKNIADNRINLIKADIRKESISELKLKLKGINFDVVVDFISYTLDEMKKTLDFVDCKQYIFISSATVYTPKNDLSKYKEFDEKNNIEWNYCKNKIECENYLIEKAQKDKNFIYTIVRPYVTYDEKRIPFQMTPGVDYYTIIDRILRGLPIVICGDNVKCTVTSSKDFAVGIVGLFQNKKAFNEDFHITSDKYTTWEEIISLLAINLKAKVEFIKIPLDYMKKININNTIIDIKQVLSDKSRNMIFDNSKIKDAVPEYNSCSNINDNIDDIVTYYKKGNNKKVNYLWNGCLDRIIYDYNKRKINIDVYKINNKKNYILYIIGNSSILYNCYYKGYKLLKYIYKIYKNLRGRQ